MIFYFPLNLGVETTQSNNHNQSHVLPGYDAWREGVESHRHDFEPKPESDILDEVLRNDRNETTVIVGEPGSGKTRLMEQWLAKNIEKVQTHGLDTPIPVLIRLRRFNGRKSETLEQALDNELREVLWNHGLSEISLPDIDDSFDCSTIYQPQNYNTFPVLWLFDGLDEIDTMFLRNEVFYQQINQLPGRKVITCRTATHQTLRNNERRYFDKTLTLLPLKPNEQLNFLKALPDCAEPESLHRQINAHSQLRPLAGNPLMLDIMGSLVELPLPTTRHDLYENAVRRLWNKIDQPVTTSTQRNALLINIAERTGLTDIQFPLETLEAAIADTPGVEYHQTLKELHTAGLVRVLDNERCQFIHLTFHEFFLAQSFVKNHGQTPLDHLILDHWQNPRIEETLALVIAHHLQEGSESDVHQALDRLINEGTELCNNDRQTLIEIGRSPLRTALHLIHRSGCDLRHYPMIRNRLHNAIVDSKAGLRILAVARDPRTPDYFLRILATDDNNEIRRRVAWNASTPTESLKTLANDTDENVRSGVAGNDSTPNEILVTLATDDDDGVRYLASENPNTPIGSLATLATDNQRSTRIGLADSPNAPTEILATLATDDDESVRATVVRNARTPADILKTLASDDSNIVRMLTGINASTPAETFATLATDDDKRVRKFVARAPVTPAESLATLATDNDEEVRFAVARNPSTPANSIASLATDDDGRVRMSVADNPCTPDEILLALSTDDDGQVRRAVALNTSTPAETLATLATDDNKRVGEAVSLNASTLLELL